MRVDFGSILAAMEPAARDLPPFALGLADAQEQMVSRRQSESADILAERPMFRGFRVLTNHDWWTTYFYRFADPVRRRRDLPYQDRLKNATAFLLDANWVVYYSSGVHKLGGHAN